MPDSDVHTLPPTRPSGAVPPTLRGLVDDAAMFPPGDAPLAEAVAQHRGYREAPFAALVGPLVVPAEALEDLAALVDDGPELAISVVLGPSAVEEAVRAVAAASAPRLHGLEVRLDADQPRAEQVAALATRLEALADEGVLPDDALVHVELPRPGEDDAEEVLDAVARHGLRAKLRTGGGSADLFPSDDELARWIAGVVQRHLAFKCTAGLHQAVRHRARDTGFEHHGHLNVLLATARAAAGGTLTSVTGALADRDADAVAEAVRTAGHADLARGREHFASYGSCSVREPLEHLVALGLLPDLPPEEADLGSGDDA